MTYLFGHNPMEVMFLVWGTLIVGWATTMLLTYRHSKKTVVRVGAIFGVVMFGLFAWSIACSVLCGPFGDRCLS